MYIFVTIVVYIFPAIIEKESRMQRGWVLDWEIIKLLGAKVPLRHHLSEICEKASVRKSAFNTDLNKVNPPSPYSTGRLATRGHRHKMATATQGHPREFENLQIGYV
jgi:hypothetical protein